LGGSRENPYHFRHPSPLRRSCRGRASDSHIVRIERCRGRAMSRREFTRTIDLMVRTWGPRVNEAALAFEARWTRRALRNHNPKLADAFEVALADFDRDDLGQLD